MKPIRFSKFMGQSRTLRSFRLALAAPAVGLTLASAQAGTPAAPAAATESAAANWISLTIGGAFVSGDDAGMRSRTRTNGDFYGGIDSLQYSQAIDKSTTLSIDGHALPGLEDYEVNINLEKADVGYLKAGYKQFRTWSDGSGGYYPGNQYSVPTWGDDLTLDRGEITFEAGLRMEKMPEVTFSYKHAFRNGQKDSLAWGEGIPSNIANTFKVMPALWDIDEKSDTFELDVEHTLGNTDLGLGLTYEHASYTNSRVNTRGYDTNLLPTSTQRGNSFRTATQTDDYTMDLFAGNIHSVTRFSDTLWLTAGFAYNSIDTDTTGGTRSFDYPYAIYKSSRGGDAFYKNMQGGAQVEQLIGNLNVMWVPMPDLTVTPSLRYEHENQSGWNLINSYTLAIPTVPATAATSTFPIYGTDSEKDATTGAIDIRYNGIENMVLYARAQWAREEESILLQNLDPAFPDWRNSEVAIDEQEYSLGANWYPMSGLSFALQGLHTQRDQGFNHSAVNYVGGSQTLRPVMVEHDTTLDDVNLRMTWRPCSNLSLVTRYDYTQLQYDNRGITWTGSNGTPAVTATLSPANNAASILGQIESGNTISHIVSESVTWSPMARLYVQGTASYIWSQTDTGFTGIVDSDNDYFSGSITAGYAIDDKTDLTGSVTYFGASNYGAAPASMGYGLNTEEFSVSLTLTRAITANMIWNLRYGWITSNTDPMPDQTGGYNDFSAHMLSTGLQIRF